VSRRALRLTVPVKSLPEPARMRAAIATRLAGRAFPGRAEDEVAAQVAAAVHAELARRTGEGPRWR
jgi:hypothetical protein